jgi:hypothetical protein
MAHIKNPTGSSMDRYPEVGSRTPGGHELGRTPKVTNPFPAIFIPLDKDITQPFDEPRGRIERAKSVLSAIDFHKHGTQHGLLHLAELERLRILRQAEDYETQNGRPVDAPTLPTDEADDMIARMSAPAVPGVNYNVSNDDLRPKFSGVTDTADRKDTVRQLSRVVEDTMAQLVGFERHMEGERQRLLQYLEKDERRLGPQPGSSNEPGLSRPMAGASFSTFARVAEPDGMTTSDRLDGDGDMIMDSPASRSMSEPG